MPLTILVADDDLGTRLSISDYLDLSGYSVITVDNGIDALAMVEKRHPDLMVTDIMMPQMNGYELVRRVRQLSAFRLLPVILLTERERKPKNEFWDISLVVICICLSLLNWKK